MKLNKTEALLGLIAKILLMGLEFKYFTSGVGYVRQVMNELHKELTEILHR
jgi:hypothetical protein